MGNFTGQFQHHPPPGMPFMPTGASKPVNTPPGPLSKENLRAVLKRLVSVSQDIEITGKSLAISVSAALRTQLQEKMDKLSKEQAEIMKKIVDTAGNTFLKKEFMRLTQSIGQVQTRIKNCKTERELDKVQTESEDLVNAWINVFKDITMDAIKCSKE